MSILIRRQENGIPMIVVDGHDILGTGTDTLPEVRKWLAAVYSPEVVEKLVAPLEADPELRQGPEHTSLYDEDAVKLRRPHAEAHRMIYASVARDRPR